MDDDCDGVIDNGYIDGSGKYYLDVACGNCFTDCTTMFNYTNAYGRCNSAGEPICEMICVDGYYNCDGDIYNGCESTDPCGTK